MKNGSEIIYKGCLIRKRSSNNFLIYCSDITGGHEKRAISLENAKAIVNTFYK